ncbi:hypothetical protein [Nocardioides sp.]|uniref:hypothetical protein n=1 Tax=Nocardioides sp. TaxID=35761 RepID=UPI002CE996A6|nr:hypothetical protein [Nocardioides sp.]HSX67467.1 hypothetical protein [Nocardioides sp.]
MTDEIPRLSRPEDMPPVRTQADLHRHFRALMGQLGFSSTSLWLAFFDEDGGSVPFLQQVEDLPTLPDRDDLASLMRLCDYVLGMAGVPDGSVGFLISRPGGPGVSASDRAWAAGLTAAARACDVRAFAVHLANDVELRAFTPDDAVA